jgi:hypothetical protein
LGVIKGQITDSESNIPIPSARITILENGKPSKKGAIADVNGYFRIKDVPVGRISLKVNSLGYEVRTMNDLLLTSGKELNLNITMVESVIKTQDVEVVYDRAKDNQMVMN